MFSHILKSIQSVIKIIVGWVVKPVLPFAVNATKACILTLPTNYINIIGIIKLWLNSVEQKRKLNLERLVLAL